MAENFERGAVYFNGVKMGAADRLTLHYAVGKTERLIESMGKMTVAINLAAGSVASLRDAFERLGQKGRWRWRSLRYQLKRKGKPGWRYIR